MEDIDCSVYSQLNSVEIHALDSKVFNPGVHRVKHLVKNAAWITVKSDVLQKLRDQIEHPIEDNVRYQVSDCINKELHEWVRNAEIHFVVSTMTGHTQIRKLNLR